MSNRVAPTGAPPHQDESGGAGSGTSTVVVVAVAGQRIGIPVADVVEIQPVVAITALPGAPPAIEGVVDLRGEPVPVLAARLRLGVEPRGVQLSDRLVVARVRGRLLALRVDAAVSLAPVSMVDLQDAVSLTSDKLVGAGLARLDDGLLVVHDVESFLSPGEVADLDDALARIDGR